MAVKRLKDVLILCTRPRSYSTSPSSSLLFPQCLLRLHRRQGAASPPPLSLFFSDGASSFSLLVASLSLALITYSFLFFNMKPSLSLSLSSAAFSAFLWIHPSLHCLGPISLSILLSFTTHPLLRFTQMCGSDYLLPIPPILKCLPCARGFFDLLIFLAFLLFPNII